AEAEREQRIQDAVNRINQITEQLDQPEAEDEDAAEASPEQTDILSPEDRQRIEELQEQVESGEITPEQAEAESAQILDEAASEREQRAADERAKEEALQNLLK